MSIRIPLVSIITPVYNGARLLPEMIANLQEQTFVLWECILIDDGSTDGTPGIVREVMRKDDRFAYYRQENRGPSAARNLGIQKSCSQYLQFLDADDLIELRKLERHVAYLQSHPETDLVYGAVRHFREEFRSERTLSNYGGNFSWTTHLSDAGQEVIRALVRANLTAVNAPLFRRELTMRVGFLDESLRAGEDWEFWFRCALLGARFHFLDEPQTLALHRSHATNVSRNRVLMTRGEVLVREKMDRLLSDEELRATNRAFLEGTRNLLQLEEIMEERKPVTRWLRLLQSGTRSRSVKWFLLSAVLPFTRDLRLQKIFTPLKARVLPFFARSKSDA